MVDSVNTDLGLDAFDPQSSSLVLATDIKRYLNEGHREIFKMLLKLKEDYFLTEEVLTIVPGQNEYPLPDYIYSNKIRKVSFEYSNLFNTLTKLSFDEYIALKSPNYVSSSLPSGYFIIDTGLRPEQHSVRSVKIIFLPPQSLGSVESINIYYLRNVNDMIEDSDIPDIPGCDDYLVSYAKWKVAQVDPTRTMDLYDTDMKEKRQNFLETYIDRTPEEGGTALEINPSTLDMHRGPAENY